jgi:phosphate transport system ATP-binding protein
MSTSTGPAESPAASGAVRYGIRTRELNLWYGDFQALVDITVDIKQGIITSLIGPSGCGKTTLLRCFNRINERYGNVTTTGEITILGKNVYDSDVSLSELRKTVGMVFQRPNPLPISVYENIVFGKRIHARHETMLSRGVGRLFGRPTPESRDGVSGAGHSDGGLGPRVTRAQRDEMVESALRDVKLWDDVKDHLKKKATTLTLEGQQKLCIARLLPLKPRIILMDEPCSALDAAGIERVEEMIGTLRERYTIVIVTHNMAQARRASDECLFMLMGKLVEHGRTEDVFLNPREKETEMYIQGRYG